MNRILCFIISIAFSMSLYAQTVEKPVLPSINWTSRDSRDEVTINNGTGKPMTVQITVIQNADNDAPGIDITNCGNTTHIDAGSTAICISDGSNPITFESDSAALTNGTYQIK